MPILPNSGFLSGGGGKSGDSGGKSGGGGKGWTGGAFGIGKGSSSQPASDGSRLNEGSRTLFSHLNLSGGVKGARPNNDGRPKSGKDRDYGKKEKKVDEKNAHKRSVTNKSHPSKLDRGETMIFDGDIVSKDPHGGWNINGTHFHDGAAPWQIQR